MSYQDRWTRYHHKKTDGVNPSSGNGYLYTAYAVKVGLPVDYEKLKECFKASTIKLGDRYEIVRNPGATTSPVSRDEILGLVELKLVKPEHLKDWSFSPFKIPAFNLVTLVKQLPALYEHRTERNYFWQNNLDQIYRFAFSVPVQDRYYILKTWGMFQWYNPAHLYYATRSKIASMGKLKPGNGVMFIKYRKGIKEMAMEFPTDHPIYLAVNK